MNQVSPMAGHDNYVVTFDVKPVNRKDEEYLIEASITCAELWNQLCAKDISAEHYSEELNALLQEASGSSSDELRVPGSTISCVLSLYRSTPAGHRIPVNPSKFFTHSWKKFSIISDSPSELHNNILQLHFLKRLDASLKIISQIEPGFFDPDMLPRKCTLVSTSTRSRFKAEVEFIRFSTVIEKRLREKYGITEQEHLDLIFHALKSRQFSIKKAVNQLRKHGYSIESNGNSEAIKGESFD